MLDVLFRRADVFPCSLDDLYGGLGIRKLKCLIKIICKSLSCIFFLSFVIKTLDPYPDSLEMQDSDPDSMNTDPKCRFFVTFTGPIWLKRTITSSSVTE
jgi:hypothetical protein